MNRRHIFLELLLEDITKKQRNILNINNLGGGYIAQIIILFDIVTYNLFRCFRKAPGVIAVPVCTTGRMIIKFK